MSEMLEAKRGNKGSSWEVGQTDRVVLFLRRKITERRRLKNKVIVLFKPWFLDIQVWKSYGEFNIVDRFWDFKRNDL